MFRLTTRKIMSELIAKPPKHPIRNPSAPIFIEAVSALAGAGALAAPATVLGLLADAERHHSNLKTTKKLLSVGLIVGGITGYLAGSLAKKGASSLFKIKSHEERITHLENEHQHTSNKP
ncbi:MAG TPA: hypothetical protein VHM20_06545 [Gammaproteobacteria bacterium]|jgi:hypothetical protein|nr:hypothetical protein [Gammaproteobacteria bacterium]